MNNPLQSIRNALSNRQAERRESAVEAYAALVTDLADEKPRDDHDEIEAVLEATGYSVDELEADVKALRERRTLARQLKPQASLKQQRAELQERLDESKRQADEASKAYRELQAALNPSIQELDATLAQLAMLNGKLTQANMKAAARGLERVEA